MLAPACSTQPRMTSPTSSRATFDRAIASLIAIAARSTDVRSLNAPPNDPIGVRHALRMTASKFLSIPRRSLFYPILVTRALQQVAHENAGSNHVSRVNLTWFDQGFDLGNRHPRGGRHHRIEVARGSMVNEIAAVIALPRADEREIGVKRRFQNIMRRTDQASLFSFGGERPIR